MKKLILFFTALIVSLSLAALPVNAGKPGKALDKPEILKAKGVAGTFALLQANEAWQSADASGKKRVLSGIKSLLGEFGNRVAVDVYESTGLTKETDIFLRLHARDANDNRLFIKRLMSAQVLGRYFLLRNSRLGITKGLNYAPKFPTLLALLKAAEYEGPPPIFGIIVTVDKTSEWWKLPEKKRLEMIKEHTVETLPFIKDVKRKLYHSTGLGETDFVTYFETANLQAFNELLITLKSIKEGQYTTYETPVVGTISTFDAAFR